VRQLNATNSISVKCLSDRTVDRSGNYAANARNGGARARTHTVAVVQSSLISVGERMHKIVPTTLIGSELLRPTHGRCATDAIC